MSHPTSLERRLGDWLRARLPHGLTELVMFTVKMGWASLFGGLLLIAMLASHAVWQEDWPATRIWLYKGQTAGEIVSFSKMGSWYLLLYVSFVTVTLVQREALQTGRFTPDRAKS